MQAKILQCDTKNQWNRKVVFWKDKKGSHTISQTNKQKGKVYISKIRDEMEAITTETIETQK